ncbi:T9SS type A sorting domain-containing protein [Flavobacterium sp. SUN052]|uniref:T9SS type A sorting domain-containing protein n=1 Tax=Flavobacterium sp. SUN052 TaxID=3002441 RepID=UPI00237E890D|nr:T9SS type A sorting domain-containing protein [Flavobacterium sp. SUN052]MEC4005740.1 T9SS type A sorting domain-containing protein [Flavobacterium sp. SUN052]
MQSSVTSQIALDLNYQNIKIDTNNNGFIEQSEALQVGLLNVSFGSITDLGGIEYFTNLKTLICHFNSISYLNIATLTHLIGLRCDVNNLTTINLNGNIVFESLQCNNNNITSIDFNGVPNLKSVNCKNNQISSLDFSNNSLLNQLYCSNNNLISLNIKNGINQDFSVAGYNDCWKTGNPNLTTICADASEVASVQSFLDGCGTAQTINVTSNCGLSNQEFSNQDFSIYPNPNNGNFIVDMSEEKESCQLKLYNALGKEVFVTTLFPQQLNKIDVTFLAKGCYVIKMSNSTKIMHKKIIIN